MLNINFDVEPFFFFENFVLKKYKIYNWIPSPGAKKKLGTIFPDFVPRKNCTPVQNPPTLWEKK